MLFCGAQRILEKPDKENLFFTCDNDFDKKFLKTTGRVDWYFLECAQSGDVYLPGDKEVNTINGWKKVSNLTEGDSIQKVFVLPDMYLSDLDTYKWYAYQLFALKDGEFYLPYPPSARDLSNVIGHPLQPISKHVYRTRREVNTEGLEDDLLKANVETALEVIRIFWDCRGEIIPGQRLIIQGYHNDTKVLKCIQFLLLKFNVLSKIDNNRLYVTDWESKKLFLRFINTYKMIDTLEGITGSEGIKRNDLFFYDELYSVTIEDRYSTYISDTPFLIDNTRVR